MMLKINDSDDDPRYVGYEIELDEFDRAYIVLREYRKEDDSTFHSRSSVTFSLAISPKVRRLLMEAEDEAWRAFHRSGNMHDED